MTSKFLDSILLTKEKAESLKNIRIIKKNLIHVHGFPKTLAKSNTLKSPEYFGQYGTIIRSMISYKINPDNKRKNYSAYITYSNEREAALAILCVDSLMIKGKIIRAFFGTTKYCRYFLNNSQCPNSENCFFLQHILLAKPYFNNINSDFLKKMEFDYFKKDLMKQGINIYFLLNGCLDCIN